VVPVAVGTGAAIGDGGFIAWRAAAALVVALAVQVATNYANDYSDGIRGTDDVRVGPVRLVASKLATPVEVKRASMMAFGVAAVAGLALASVAGWWLVAVGAACFAAGWFYTGGSRPYGYAGLGEVFVFVFFGLVAVVGTAYVQTERITATAVVAAVPVGLLACALLVVNNLRDIPSDTDAGKRTLAVRLGDTRTRTLYAGCLWGAVLVTATLALSHGWAAVALVAVPLMLRPLRAVQRRATGRDLIAVLQDTARFQLAFGLLLAIGLAR
jgi:1,4-dihydroxy-2-naphthoate octaprenyltransferase